MASTIIPNVRKIAILRANALGDLLFTLPAFRALRQAYPEAELVCLAREWHMAFMPGHVPDIDRVVVVPPYPGVSIPGGQPLNEKLVAPFFTAMQAEQFDLAFQLHGGGGNSNPFVRRLGAQLSFGAQAPGASSLDVSVPYSYYHNDIQRWLEVVSYAGARTGDTEPQVVVLESDRKEANRMMRAKAVAKPYIVLHPGASDPRRRWPAEYFAWVARQLYRRGFSIVVTGITAEQMVVEAVVHQAAGAAISCCGQLSLGGMAGLLAGAALVVSNDTGPLHLAAAVGAKTVGIYWIGNVIMAAEPTRMRHELLVDWTTDCPRCGRSCVSSGFPFDASACNHAVSFVSKVEPKAVLTSCLRLLGLIK